MESIYPSNPTSVPDDLTQATSQYKRQAWLAMGGLLLFVLIYLGLTVWFGWSTYRLIEIGISDNGDLGHWIRGLCSGFLTLFMLKALFFVKSSGQNKDFELKPKDHPRLFEFLYRLADETKAPRPHRVFLSPDVNACVFYDLSLLNFIFPSKKNLDIGLGLVNVLNLSEFKAVLAHEYGHFAQSTMAVGRWVYTAQQIAVQLIYHRDALDGFLNVLSQIDLRVAWIAWLLRLVVWSIRSILDTLLQLVLLAHRALSREMEFQADLVAVSVTGSDALVNALHRLPAADHAWEKSKGFIEDEIRKGHRTLDFFAVQKRVLEYQRTILNDPLWGETPVVPSTDPEKHRVFTADLAQPPKMWATHPHNHERETNAKNRYISAELDNRSAWEIFDNPDKLKKELSAHLLSGIEKIEDKSLEETIRALDKTYEKEYFNSMYRGTYLGRSIVAYAKSIEDLYEKTMGNLKNENLFSDLYPESLTDDLEKLRNLEQEKSLLEALKNKTYQTPDGVIRFRGEVIKYSDLGEAIETVEQDLKSVRNRVLDHDRKCRTTHRLAASQLGGNAEAYIVGLLKALHYAEHTLVDLMDLNGVLHNTYAVVTADGNVSRKELRRLVDDATHLHMALQHFYSQQDKVILDESLLERLKIKSWKELLEEFKLAAPTQETIGDWFSAIDSWIAQSGNALSALQEVALEELLHSEASIARALQEGSAPEPLTFPAPSQLPDKYPILLPGEERKLQTKLNWWDSFQTATGIVPTIMRFLVSFAIVGGAIFITWM